MKYRKELFSYKKIYDHTGTNDLFLEAMKESLAHHYEKNNFYRKVLDNYNFDYRTMSDIKDVYSIPPIPVNYFKYHEEKSISDDEIDVYATSSGTTGQKSQVFLDESSMKLGRKMIIKSMRYHGLFSIIPTNYLLLGYEPKEGNESGNTKVLTGMTFFAPPLNKTYAIKNVGGEYQVDFVGVIKSLQRFNKMRLPVRILGFPSYLYMLLKHLENENIKMNLNSKSVILTGGGWKQFNHMKIDKDELYSMVEERLGIQKCNIRDFFSAVEHSVAYPECKNNNMHIPIWSRVVMRDVETLQPLGYNEPGFINFISPLVSSMPISSILMSDLGVLYDGKTCGCGIETPCFKVLSRVGKNKSCAVTASELMNKGEM